MRDFELRQQDLLNQKKQLEFRLMERDDNSIEHLKRELEIERKESKNIGIKNNRQIEDLKSQLERQKEDYEFQIAQ